MDGFALEQAVGDGLVQERKRQLVQEDNGPVAQEGGGSKLWKDALCSEVGSPHFVPDQHG